MIVKFYLLIIFYVFKKVSFPFQVVLLQLMKILGLYKIFNIPILLFGKLDHLFLIRV